MSGDDFSPVWSDDDRPRIPRVAGEREALTAYLEYFRATIAMKCRGLSTEQAGRRSAPPSTMSLHGVVRHLASVERWWFQQNFERRDVPMLHPGTTDFEPPPGADLADDLATWEAECAVSREIVAAHDLDDVVRPLTGTRTSTCAGCCCGSSRSTRSTAGTPTCCGRASTGGPGPD